MRTICYVVVLVLIGCASQPPASISRIPADSLSVAEVRASSTGFVGAEVRWGGEITRVDNKASQTWVEIISRGLRDDGRPQQEGQSSGRFIASFQGFVDPVDYEVGRQITVLGSIEGKTTRLIGEHEYLFPVVSVTGFHLWPWEPEFIEYDSMPPWWYYDPWPYYPGPYYPWGYPPYYW